MEPFISRHNDEVYCRPSCAAHMAGPKNVHFFATREEAEAADFRPCKHCQGRSNGALSGYRGAVERKRVLLEKESSGPQEQAEVTGE